ncbi:hypothetical protein [Actinokineospora iranica]|uniref:Core-binding (CB) domain-containing protein n=1 Tax=Actinokineospora iranica TaxID=1271860 RepID=A0A1G6NEJ1_9PSEU|nr:hypothetical protein [Actinokineospora iranica]SDC65615.1 hypothetical protein SAMN05216174_103301 [Actinokineospora iranica]
MSPGKRAVLPPAGYARPSNLSSDGLTVSVVAEDGEELGEVDFQAARGPEKLRLQVVAAFAKACSSTGTWTRYSTCENYGGLLKRFLVFVADLDTPPAEVGQITPGIWSQWLLSGQGRGHSARLIVRKILVDTGALPAETTAVIAVRSGRRKPSKQVEAYTLAEFKLVRATARREATRIERRVAAGLTLLARYRGGEFPAGSYEARLGALLDQVSWTGDVDRYGDGQLHERVREVCRLVPGGYRGVMKMLFPSATEIGALAALLVCEEGWNLSVLESMDVPDFRPDGGIGDVEIHRVSTLKHRRPVGSKHASNNLVDLGDGSAGQALRKVVGITAEARACLGRAGTPTRRLLVGHRVRRRRDGRGPWLIGAPKHVIDMWCEYLALESPSGGVLKVGAARLRQTHQALFGGPRQNTLRTHEDVYLLRNAQVRAESADVVAAGLQGAVDHATATVRMRLLRASPTPDESELAQLAEQAGIPLRQVQELVRGDLDTATGACRDFAHSPFTPDGPCSVSFLMCFACDNALATPRHLPRIVYLHDALAGLRSVVSGAAWTADWARHYSRVGDLLAACTTPAERSALRGRLTDRDRVLIDQVLDRRLDS